MNNFTCAHCNYTTNRSANYSRHLSSTKHINKVNDEPTTDNGTSTVLICSATNEQNFVNQKTNENEKVKEYMINMCSYCNKGFSRSDNLTKHLRYCLNRQKFETKLTEKIKFLENKNKNQVVEMKYIETEKNHYKDEMNHYKKLLIEAGKLVKTSVNALTYVVDNYDDAPVIKQIKFNDITTKRMNTIQFIEEILSAYKHKTLNKYLGDLIIGIYKKKNPEDQSLWNTDTYRLTYLLKELLENKTSNWIVDKKGSKTIEYIIDPVLKHIKKLMLKYNTYVSKKKIKPNSVDFEIALENSKVIVKLANEIDDGITGKAMLKYISPKMRLEKKKNIKL